MESLGREGLLAQSRATPFQLKAKVIIFTSTHIAGW